MAHVFESNQSQSHLYAGRVVSISAMVQQAGSDPGRLIELLSTNLGSYFRAYYRDGASVEAFEVPTQGGLPGTTVRIDITIVEAQATVKRSWQLLTNDNVVVSIVEMLNG